ncbi:MAG TPA: hypothetical protein VN285_05730 [Candidatus Deferrimicrobium sp.]|nr:hypothetical protein [Candidatus Deferrimicrobium sp.]
MILVRDIFEIQFGKMKEAKTAWEEGFKILKNGGWSPTRLLTDLTGKYYTLVLESTYKSLADFEKAHSQAGHTKAMQDWYRKFTPLVMSGRREIFTIVEMP